MGTFDNITTMIEDIVPVFDALLVLIIVIIPIMIIIAFGTGLANMFANLFNGIFGIFGKMAKK